MKLNFEDITNIGFLYNCANEFEDLCIESIHLWLIILVYLLIA